MNEVLLEVFFESKKKYGGGPVKSVKIMKEKGAALVEFLDENAVDDLMKKKPIMYGTTKLDVNPFNPLVSGDVPIARADVMGITLPKNFTKRLLAKDIEGHAPVPMPY